MLYQVSDIKSITNQANRKSFIIIITGDNAAPVIESDSWCGLTIGQNNLHLHIIEDFLIAWKKTWEAIYPSPFTVSGQKRRCVFDMKKLLWRSIIGLIQSGD